MEWTLRHSLVVVLAVVLVLGILAIFTPSSDSVSGAFSFSNFFNAKKSAQEKVVTKIDAKTAENQGVTKDAFEAYICAKWDTVCLCGELRSIAVGNVLYFNNTKDFNDGHAFEITNVTNTDVLFRFDESYYSKGIGDIFSKGGVQICFNKVSSSGTYVLIRIKALSKYAY